MPAPAPQASTRFTTPTPVANKPGALAQAPGRVPGARTLGPPQRSLRTFTLPTQAASPETTQRLDQRDSSPSSQAAQHMHVMTHPLTPPRAECSSWTAAPAGSVCSQLLHVPRCGKRPGPERLTELSEVDMHTPSTCPAQHSTCPAQPSTCPAHAQREGREPQPGAGGGSAALRCPRACITTCIWIQMRAAQPVSCSPCFSPVHVQPSVTTTPATLLGRRQLTSLTRVPGSDALHQ